MSQRLTGFENGSGRMLRGMLRVLGAAGLMACAAAGYAQEGVLGPAWLGDHGTVQGGTAHSKGKAGLTDFSAIGAGGNRVELEQDRLAPPALLDAVRKSDLAAVRRLIESGTPVNLPDAVGGTTALFYAVQGGNIDMARLLLQYRADPNVHAANGLTPLMHAVLQDDRWMARLLLRRGADPDARDASGKRPLFAAIEFVHNAVAAELVGAHADLSLENGDQQTALVYAIVEGDIDVVRRIAAEHAYLNREDGEGRTPLYWALFFKRDDAVAILKTAGARQGSQKIADRS